MQTNQHNQDDAQPRQPWNAGRIIGAKPPLKPKHIWGLRALLTAQDRKRDLALFNVAIDSKLKGCDLVQLKVTDLMAGGHVKSRATIVQKKTGMPVSFELTEPAKEAVIGWAALRRKTGGVWLFPSRSHIGEHLTTRQYARLVDNWIEIIGLNPADYGTHSLRRTKVALVYRRTGNIRACQILLGHTKLESTVRYLGVDIDDALIMSEQTDI
jgi:integrase